MDVSERTDLKQLAISWDGIKGRGGRTLLAVVVATALAVSSLIAVRQLGQTISVIVRESRTSTDVPERAVRAVGGDVGRHIGIIGGFVATVPVDAVPALRGVAGVLSITPDASIELLHATDGYNPAEDAGSMFSTAKAVKAGDMWSDGITGRGVDVALIDSGVVPVEGLDGSDKVVNGPDLSFESQAESLRYLDTFGHGTHMAGIIAGKDAGAVPVGNSSDHHSFLGVAPHARIVSVKVANALGAADVSQVIAAIDWVVQHKNDAGMNIRVLNLSFGTDGVQDYMLDPLTYAAEVAWHQGIVVVVAAGNAGFGNAKLNNPAYDPYVIAVGASDTKGTFDTSDDVTPDWTSRGDGTRNPDLVAPGKSVVSLRSPNSYSDQEHPTGRVGTRFFRGSGTSQAAAAVSGAAALILQQHPSATPDQVKKLLMETASPLPVADPVAQGKGVLNLKEANRTPTAEHTQTFPRATGLGSLEAARGTGHVVDDTGMELRGEIDIFGEPWDAQSWSAQSWSRQSWSGGDWMRQSWSGDSWSTDAWNRQSWSAQSWSAQSWSAQSWSAQSWSAQSWSRQSWSRQSWSRQSWSSASWGGDPVPLSTTGWEPAASPSPGPAAEPANGPSPEAAPVEEPAAVPSPEATSEPAPGSPSEEASP